jgi:hypothetical protein
MSDPLATYLQDHLAGAKHAIDLLENLRTRHAGQPLGQFAAMLLAEVEADRGVLRGLAETIGGGPSELKEMAAWVSEKLSRIKLNDDADGFGTFEALEFLEIGIRGKRLLWIALGSIVATDHRLHGPDYARLVARAETQEKQVDERRLEIAPTAFVRHEIEA